MNSDLQVPEGWRWFSLGEKFSIAIGGTPSRNIDQYWDYNKVTQNRWVSIKDLDSRYITDTKEYISDKGVSKSNVKLVPSGTVMMSFKLTVGRVAFAGANLYTNEAIAAFLPTNDNDVSVNFLYQGLQHWNLLEYSDQAVKGITLNKEKIYNIQGLFPPLPEQNKIATILTSVDDVIEKTEAQINKLQDLKKGMMTELLTKGIDHTEFKDSPVGRIPVEWDIVNLGMIIGSMVGGVSVNSDNRKKMSSEVGILKTSSVSNGYFYPIEHKVILPNEIQRVKINPTKDHILFSRMNTPLLVGESGYVEETHFDLFLPDRLWMINVKNRKKTNVRWLSYVLASGATRQKIADVATGTSGSMKNIAKPNLLAIKIAIPSVNEQEKIAQTIRSLDVSLKSKQKKLSQTKSLKKALMNDLLTGKKRVNVN